MGISQRSPPELGNSNQEAKALGARFCMDVRKWYVPAGYKLVHFALRNACRTYNSDMYIAAIYSNIQPYIYISFKIYSANEPSRRCRTRLRSMCLGHPRRAHTSFGTRQRRRAIFSPFRLRTTASSTAGPSQPARRLAYRRQAALAAAPAPAALQASYRARFLRTSRT
jgi:hypothetical protein